MRRLLYFFNFLPLLLLCQTLSAQIKIAGKVIDDKGKAVKGANVYLNNTIDGGTTDSMGAFRFTTTETGSQSLVVTEVGHQTMGIPMMLTHDTSGMVMMMSANHNLDVVTITAGAFGSADRTKTVLSPLDIVTTAGSNGDLVKAMEMMPGTQQTGTDNGLLVRGGDASEAAILADGMVIENAFVGGPPGMATRSRFNAFQYQGVLFSSGGYSARYGQAMSGVLELNTNDMPDKSNVNLGINMGGIYASGTKKWKKSAIDFGGGYNNLTPFYKLAKTNFNFFGPSEGGSGNVRYTWVPNKNGILKATFTTSYNKSGIGLPNPYAGTPDSSNFFHYLPDTIKFLTRDLNYYSNLSFKQMFKNKYTLFAAASYSLDRTNNSFQDYPIKQDDHRAQMRVEGKDFITTRVTLLVGGELQSFGLDKHFDVYDTTLRAARTANQNFIETQEAAYAEVEWTPLYWLAVKPGVRYEHSTLLNTSDVAPRLSMAIRTSNHSQISLATGIFYQNPDNLYLLANTNAAHPTVLSGNDLKMQDAVHYIANWQWGKRDRTLRVEGYYKSYQNLVRELQAANSIYDPNRYRTLDALVPVNNSGYGYAQGFELFWRDKTSIKNADYWITYSYIDTRRLYGNFPFQATPTFIARNTLSVVGKYFVDKIHTNFSATYSFSSGYPYFDPTKPLNDGTFLKGYTPTYNNVSLTVAYLHSFGKWFSVFYLSADNIFNMHNVFGYRYLYNSSTGGYTQSPVVPALYRTVFIGVNASLSQFSKDEL